MAVEEILIQSFLLLLNESFLERHLFLLVQLVHNVLYSLKLLLLLPQELALTRNLILVVAIIVVLPILCRVNIVARPARQQLIFLLLTLMADALRVPRHALYLIADAVGEQVNAVHVGRKAIVRRLRVLGHGDDRLLGRL